MEKSCIIGGNIARKKITIYKENRRLDQSVLSIGFLGENKIEKIEFIVPEEYKEFSKKACFSTIDGTFSKAFDNVTSNILTIDKEITKYNELDCNIQFFKTIDDDEIIAKTSNLHLVIEDSIVCDDDVENDDPKVLILDSLIEKVTNLDKVISENETQREEYMKHLKSSVENGDFNGKDATINGFNTLNIVAGTNIDLKQENETLEINNTYQYDDSELVKKIDNINDNFKNYSLITETGNKLDLTIDSKTYIMTLKLKDKDDNVLSTGSVDLPIESMIINVTYDNDNEKLTFTLQNGSVIDVPLDSLISGLVNETDLKDTLKDYAKTTDVPTKVSELENDSNYVKNTDMDKVIPKNKVSGESIFVNDAVDYKIFNTSIDGKHEQETTTGKNLLSNVGGITQTINGITFTKNNNGTITANGTATDNINYYINGYNYTDIEPNTYYLSDKVNGESNNTYFTYYEFKNNDTQNLATYGINTRVISSKLEGRSRIVVRSGQTLNNVVFKPMLEANSIETDFEPYTGGQASPSPNYPSKIKQLEGIINLLNFDDFSIGSLANGQSLPNYQNRINNASKPIPVAPNTTYIISICDIGNIVKGLRVGIHSCDSNGTFIEDSGWHNISKFYSYTTDSNTQYIKLVFSTSITSNNVQTNSTEDITKFSNVNDFLRGMKIALSEKKLYNIIPSGSNYINLVSHAENLLPNKIQSKTVNGITCTNNDDGTITLNGTATAKTYLYPVINEHILLALDGDYTFSANTYTNLKYSLYHSAEKLFFWEINSDKTFSAEGLFDNVRPQISIESGVTFNNVIVKIQLKKGTNPTLDFPMYKQHLLPIDLKNNKICEIDKNIKDKLIIDKYGNYGILKNVAKVILNGTEQWTLSDKGFILSGNVVHLYFAKRNLKSFNGVCNRFLVEKTSSTWTKVNYCGWNTAGIFWIREDHKLASTVADFKTWLSTHNVEIFYQLETPEFINLGTLPEIPTTFEGTNNMYIDSDLGTTNFEIEYCLDIKKYIDSKLNELQSTANDVATADNTQSDENQNSDLS